MPRAVDTQMVRTTMDRSPDEIPLAGWFKSAAQVGALVRPEDAAAEVSWAIRRGVAKGSTIRIGLQDGTVEALVDEQARFEVR